MKLSDQLPSSKNQLQPSLHITFSKAAYRPGESVVAFVNVVINNVLVNNTFVENNSLFKSVQSAEVLKRRLANDEDEKYEYILLEKINVEVKGTEKLDPNWIKHTKNLPFQKGERSILKSRSITIASDILIQKGMTKSYCIKFTLPQILPPSYKGISVKFHYHFSAALTWHFVSLSQEKNVVKATNPILNKTFNIEHHVPIKIWTLPNCSGLREEEIGEEDHYGAGGIVPQTALEVELQWKERILRSSWSFMNSSSEEDDEYSQSCTDISDSENFNADVAFQNDNFIGADSQNKSNRNSISNSNSNPNSTSIPNSNSNSNALETPTAASAFDTNFENKLLLQKKMNKKSIKALKINESNPSIFEPLVSEEERERERESEDMEGMGEKEKEIEQSFLSISRHRSSFMYKPKNATALLFSENSLLLRYPKLSSSLFPPSSPLFRDSSFNSSRGKTFNIRMEEQILVRFSPRDPNLSYCLGDSVSGTLSFPRDGGKGKGKEAGTGRRCVEVSVYLETHEIINPKILNSSRRNSLYTSQAQFHLPQIQSEFHEITRNLLSTHFIFSIPMDAPAAFATPIVSLQWLLRFEFVSTVPGTRSTKPEANLLNLGSEKTERGDWSIPITVNAPMPRVHSPDGLFVEDKQELKS